MALRTNLKSLAPRRQAYKKTITLLSKGYTDPTAWPGGSLTVYPWDNTVDNWLLSNVRRLNRHDLVLGLLQQCCDLNGGDVNKFVAEEINLVLLVSRALARSGTLTYSAQCPRCNNTTKETVTVPDQLEKIGEKAEGYKGYDEFTLPECKDVVRLRPLLVADEQVIVNRQAANKDVPEAELRTIMRVVSVNDTQPDTLAELLEWFRALPPVDAAKLEETGMAITPRLNNLIDHVCDVPDCGAHFKQVLTFDTDFFR